MNHVCIYIKCQKRNDIVLSILILQFPQMILVLLFTLLIVKIPNSHVIAPVCSAGVMDRTDMRRVMHVWINRREDK